MWVHVTQGHVLRMSNPSFSLPCLPWWHPVLSSFSKNSVLRAWAGGWRVQWEKKGGGRYELLSTIKKINLKICIQRLWGISVECGNRELQTCQPTSNPEHIHKQRKGKQPRASCKTRTAALVGSIMGFPHRAGAALGVSQTSPQQILFGGECDWPRCHVEIVGTVTPMESDRWCPISHRGRMPAEMALALSCCPHNIMAVLQSARMCSCLSSFVLT